jgi:hypothetical protein
MSDPNRPTQTDAAKTPAADPDESSTWNTIAGTADIDDLLSEEELEDLMVEPTSGELGILTDTDVPGEPG